MTPNEDQLLAHARDVIPRLWGAMYQGALAAGFSASDAMGLVQTWILSQNPNGIRPTGSGTSPTDTE